MALDKAIREEMRETVTVRPRTALDEYGRPTHGAGTVYEARVVERSQALYGIEGDVIRSDATIWIAPDSSGNLPTVIPGETILTLPDGTEPRILAVDSYDKSGPQGELNHVKVWIGLGHNT